MKNKTMPNSAPTELVVATGLVWGHLQARQFDEARRLAKACLHLWPKDRNITQMARSAAAEVIHPIDKDHLYDNPVWSSDYSVPYLHALQKVLDEQSIPLSTEARVECMDAISLIERAVQLRLRWVQMRKSNAVLAIRETTKPVRKTNSALATHPMLEGDA